MFDNILLCSFALKNNGVTIDTVFALAKKFESSIMLLKCFHEDFPTFALFRTKAETKKQNELAQKTQLALEEIQEAAKRHNIPIKTEGVFVESLSDYVTTYIQKNDIDLLIIDSIPPSNIAIHDHKDVINRIYKNVECPILTLK